MNPEPNGNLKSTTAERQITDEDVAYSTFIESHPILESFLDRFDLCSVITGDKFMKTEQRVPVKSHGKSRTSGDYTTLMILASQVLSPDENYTKDEIIDLLQRETKVSKKEAARRFKLMADSGVLVGGSLGEPYSIHDSTPF